MKMDKLFKSFLAGIMLIAGCNAIAMSPTLGNQLLSAITQGDEAEVESLIDSEAQLINCSNHQGATPLIVAVKNNHVAIAELLLDRGANVNAQAKPLNNLFALFYAVMNRHSGMVRLLLEKGANVYLATGRGDTSLRMAARDNQIEIVKTLLTTISDADAQEMQNNYTQRLKEAGNIDEFIRALIQERMQKVHQLINLKNNNGEPARNKEILESESHQAIADLLDLDNPQSQEIIRSQIEANIWRAIKFRSFADQDAKNQSKVFNFLLIIEAGITERVEARKGGKLGALIGTLIRALENDVPIITSTDLTSILLSKRNDSNFTPTISNYIMHACEILFKNYRIFRNKDLNLHGLIPKSFHEGDLAELGLEPTFLDEDINYSKFKPPFPLDVRPTPFAISSITNCFNRQNKIAKRIVLIGHGMADNGGRLAGLEECEYATLLRFFNTINVTFLFVDSCYAGGLHMLQWHQEYGNQNLRNIELNYPIAVGALSDLPTLNSEHINYAHFFKRLNTYFAKRGMESWPQVAQIKGKLAPITYGVGAQLQHVTAAIWGKKHQNLPSIRFPGPDTTFKPIDLSNEITVINYPRLLASELEQATESRPLVKPWKAQPLSIPGEIVPIYPSAIAHTLLMEEDHIPKIISMIPGRARHVIQKIKLQNEIWVNSFLPIKDVILNMFIGPYVAVRPKAFFIHQFQINDKPPFSNVLIQIGDGSDQLCTKETEITLRYEYQGKCFKEIYQQIPKKDVLNKLSRLEQLSKKEIDSLQEAKYKIRCALHQFTPLHSALFEATDGRESDVQSEKLIEKYLK